MRRSALLARSLAQRRKLGDVRAGDERALAASAQHDRSDLLVRVEPGDLFFQLLEERGRECIDRRVVDGDDGDGPVALAGDELH